MLLASFFYLANILFIAAAQPNKLENNTVNQITEQANPVAIGGNKVAFN